MCNIDEFDVLCTILKPIVLLQNYFSSFFYMMTVLFMIVVFTKVLFIDDSFVCGCVFIW